jgi:hypothetical protein
MLSGTYRALALALSLLPLAAQDRNPNPHPDDRTIAWQRSLADVDALVAATGRPLLLALNMDGESASDRIWHENYRDPAFVELSRRCICVGASVFRHNAVDHDADGRRLECPRFPGLTCGEHIALEPALFERWFRDGDRVAPRHAVVMPGGRITFDLSLCFDLTDIDRALAAATAGIAPWQPTGGGDWTSLAQRRDARGRAQLEAALAEVRDPATWQEAWRAIGEHGDAGAIDAVRLGAARVPTLPLAPLQQAAQRLQLTESFHAACRARAERSRGDAFDLGLPSDRRVWLDALQQADDAASCGLWALAVALRPGDAEGDAPLDQQLEALGAAACRGNGPLPRPGEPKRVLADRETLLQRLTELDTARERSPDDATVLADSGIASLDLGRAELAAPTSATPLLFEDAERYLAKALAREPQRFGWWIERAHAAYYRQRHDEQRQFAIEALAVAGFVWPPAADRRSALLANAQAIEAVRWLGDADARTLAATTNEQLVAMVRDEPVRVIAMLRSAVLGLGLPAQSPFGTSKDWLGYSSFHGAYGLGHTEAALFAHAVVRLPADGELRQALYAALWRLDRWQLAVPIAERALAGGASADAAWWCGHAHVLVAEELRRRERPSEAVAHYDAARPHFAAARGQNPAYAASADNFAALAELGASLALLQGAGADRPAAAERLVAASAIAVDLKGVRDGLGYDALDVVDKLLEWRSRGPSPVAGLALLDRLSTNGASAAFWAGAIGDSLLREALRADGRNPERREAETVDASGKAITMPMGLPTELGDRYLADAVTAARRAAAAAEAGDAGQAERMSLAQSLVISAERQLVRGRSDGIAALVDEAARVLATELAPPPAADADVAAWRAWLQPLRARLGPARPRMRDGR